MKKRPAKRKQSEIGEVLEVVNFIKDRMATKDELTDFRLEVNTRLISIEQELKDIKRRLTDLENQFEKSGAINKGEFEALWKRVVTIEKRLKMQTKS